MILGDARTGKLPDHITAFGRALRRAGVPVDSSRMALAITATHAVGVERKDDLRAALEAVLVSRQQDLGVFGEMFESFFRNPELAQQLLSQMLPKAAKAHPVRRKARVQEALSVAGLKARTPNQGETELKFDAAMSASDQQRMRHADFAGLGQRVPPGRATRARHPPAPATGALAPGTRRHTRPPPPLAARVAASRRFDGELLHVPMKTRRQQPLPLLILVDISGSMERYARLLLAFLHQATRGTPRAAFAFGTHPHRPAHRVSPQRHRPDARHGQRRDRRLRRWHPPGRVTRGSAHPPPPRAHRPPHRGAAHHRWPGPPVHPRCWTTNCNGSSATRGSCCGSTPLLRFDGYQPLATGAAVLQRHAHGTLAVHNLSRLEDLARSMAALMQRA